MVLFHVDVDPVNLLAVYLFTLNGVAVGLHCAQEGSNQVHPHDVLHEYVRHNRCNPLARVGGLVPTAKVRRCVRDISVLPAPAATNRMCLRARQHAYTSASPGSWDSLSMYVVCTCACMYACMHACKSYAAVEGAACAEYKPWPHTT